MAMSDDSSSDSSGKILEDSHVSFSESDLSECEKGKGKRRWKRKRVLKRMLGSDSSSESDIDDDVRKSKMQYQKNKDNIQLLELPTVGKTNISTTEPTSGPPSLSPPPSLTPESRSTSTASILSPSTLINSIDFSCSSSTSGWGDFESAPSSKSLFFQLQAGGDEYSIIIYKKELEKLFERISAQMGLPKAKEIKLLYPLKLADGGEKVITLRYNKSAAIFKESLQQFYVQAVPYSTIAVATESVQRTRLDRPQEIRFNKYFSDYSRVDKRFYQEMITPSIAEAFVQKTKFVRVLLGTNWCVNLISPGHYLCHVRGCGDLIKLKDFNDHSRIVGHIKDHVHAENKSKNKKTKFADDKSCAVLLKRLRILRHYKHLIYSRTVDKNIEDLETRKSKSQQPNDSEFPYAIKELMKNKVLIKSSDNFKGKIFHTQLEIMEKLANLDPSALDGVSEGSSVRKMLGGSL